MSADPSQQRPGVVLPDIRPHRFRGGIRNRHQRDGTGSAAGPAGPAPEGPARPVCVSRTGTKQAVCVELLRNGDHRSFSELFSLLGADRDRRAAVESGPASGLQAPLEEQRDKMETLKVHLSRAERAERTGLWAVACDQRLFLGGFFSSPEDVWLRFHFYHSCCQTGRPLRPAAEARACLAELLLQQGDLDQARQQAECYLEQAGDEDWLDSSGRPLRLRVHQSLWRIYSRLADALLTDAPPEGANYSEALMLLHKGQRLATEADNKQMEGEASYQLGLTYQRAGDHDSAKQFFNRCVQIYSVLQDADGQVMAYKAMAKSIESQGHTHETVQCLEKLVDISHSNGLQHSLADAHLSLGSIHYKRKHHIRACQSFLGGYQVARQLEDVDLLQRAQVLVAISRAQSLIRTFSAQVDCSGATPTDLRPLLAWRETSNHQDLDSECVDPVATAWDQILVGEGPDP